MARLRDRDQDSADFPTVSLHGQSPSPFAADTRKNAIEFPFHWQEIDDVSLQVPGGYSLEAPSAPPAAAVGDILTYKVSIGPLARRTNSSSGANSPPN